MLTLKVENLHKIKTDHGLSSNELNSQNSKLEQYLNQIHARKQGFYKIVDDKETVEKIKNFATAIRAKQKYTHIVVLGIGGSALGTICLQQSLTHLFQKTATTEQPELHVVDNIDPIIFKELEEIINLQTTIFIVVTKSGGTPETLSQYFYFRNKIDQAKLPAQEHFVFITDPEKGLLRQIANEENIPTFAIPPNVGGRFSVLTPVGLLPAALIGINIDQLIRGAKNQRDLFLNNDPNQNTAFQLATIQYQLDQKNKNLTVVMPYSQKLIRLADWYRQLLAESIGKKHDNEGKTVHTGLTPINALGVTDQHSQAQLYNEGPNNKLFIFITVENLGADQPIPNLKPDNPTVSFLKNVSFKKLIHTEKRGTEQSLNQNDRPNITIEIDEVSAHFLGELFMLFQASIAFLGEMYNINAFDQPGVELSKNLTKELLLQ